MTATPPTNKPDEKSDQVAPALLDWYARHARELPWRAPPGAPAPDPYRVWLSEVMLQQTTVAAVKPFFEKFVRIWPSVEQLASASDAEVMAAWAGLGYYSRARNLIACARQVAALGAFPASETELRKLPGLGAYTAAAIAAIAFGQRAVVVDANVERVVARLFAISEPLPKSRAAIRVATDTITPDKNSGDFAQAMMDLGSQICTTRDPKCLLCPLAEWCVALKQGDPAAAARQSSEKACARAGWASLLDRAVASRETPSLADRAGRKSDAGRDARFARRWLDCARRRFWRSAVCKRLAGGWRSAPWVHSCKTDAGRVAHDCYKSTRRRGPVVAGRYA